MYSFYSRSDVVTRQTPGNSAYPELSPAAEETTQTFGALVLDGLLEEGDVLKRAEEQNHFVVLVPDGSHLHVEPDGTSCNRVCVSRHSCSDLRDKQTEFW